MTPEDLNILTHIARGDVEDACDDESAKIGEVIRTIEEIFYRR